MRQRLTRVLPYRPDQLFDLVGDVESYPRFVRWVNALRTWNVQQTDAGIVTLDAEAEIKFAIIRERFSTRVTLDRTRLAIDVALLSGPFRHLTNCWRFVAHPRGAELTFEVEFELRSRLLSGLLAANFDQVSSRLVGCFEDRAAILYGDDQWKLVSG